MSVIVTDSGFGTDDWTGGFVTPETLAANDCGELGLDLSSNADLSQIAEKLHCFALIRIDFPSFADGRGFTLAAELRRMGYSGRLRAHGHVTADQYAMARRSGFDEVEIADDLAARQPEEQWLARAAWQTRDYHARLRG